jgi:hypothetical protein
LRTTEDEVADAYRAVEEWRRFEPDVDLYVAPCYIDELPPETRTSSKCACASRSSCAG